MSKRFTKEYKRSFKHLMNDLFMRVIGKQHKGKNFTIFMVQHWIYGNTPNDILEKEFELMMKDVDPDSLINAFEESVLEPA